MAGGGTGGHVLPLLAVARELKARGHHCVFIGTRTGFEAKLVPSAGFPLEFIEIGGLNSVGVARSIRTLTQLPFSVLRARQMLAKHRPGAIFSMGGYAAGPVVLAGLWKRLPILVMEPNAIPGLTNRHVGRFVTRALLNFPETARFFPPGKSVITGLPVRPEFFAIRPKARETKLTVLITGGSQGSRRLNEAAKASWSYFREAKFPVRFIHQTGVTGHEALAKKFAHQRFEPSGFTKNPEIRNAASIIDYVFRWMALQFVPGYREANMASRNQPELAMPGLLDEVKKKINRPVPELPLSEDTDVLDVKSGNGNGHGRAGSADPVVKTLSDSVAHFQQDAPTCPNCGHVAVRNGACYKCLNCGESLGCS